MRNAGSGSLSTSSVGIGMEGGSLRESCGSRTWCVLGRCGWGGPQILLVAAGLRAPLTPGASPPTGCVLDKVSTWQSGKTENLSIVTFLIKMNLFTFVCEMSVLSK